MAAAPVRRTPPPELASARTDLTVRLSRLKGSPRARTFHITCAGGGAALGKAPARPGGSLGTAAADPQQRPVPDSAAALVERQRERQFAGEPVSRAYSGCLGAPTKRWLRFLGV